MSNADVSLSIVRALLPQYKINHLEPLTEHLHPLKRRQKSSMQLEKACYLMDKVNLNKGLKIFSQEFLESEFLKDDKKKLKNEDEILRELAGEYKEIIDSLPKAEKDSKVDFLARNEEGFFLVEVQVAKQNFWDKRALAYAANVYANQIRKGEEWKEIRKVVAVNLLGDGDKKNHPWGWGKGETKKIYKFRDEYGYELGDAIELIQYSLAAIDEDKEERKDFAKWVIFFKTAHLKTIEEVEQTEDGVFKKAYEMIEHNKWPEKIREEYRRQAENLENYSEAFKHAEKIGKAEVIQEQIAEREAEINNLREKITSKELPEKIGNELIENIQAKMQELEARLASLPEQETVK